MGELEAGMARSSSEKLMSLSGDQPLAQLRWREASDKTREGLPLPLPCDSLALGQGTTMMVRIKVICPSFFLPFPCCCPSLPPRTEARNGAVKTKAYVEWGKRLVRNNQPNRLLTLTQLNASSLPYHHTSTVFPSFRGLYNRTGLVPACS